MSTNEKCLLRAGLAIVFLVGAVLACGPVTGAKAVTVVINSPVSGASVAVGQEVLIDSTASANAGVARVELSVGGVVERRDVPPSGSPTTFRVSQPWTPTAEGQAMLSVVAYDVNGNSSDVASITLQVVASGAVLPTVVPGGPTETPPPPVTTEAGCTLGSQYIADVTIPDGTVMSPEQAFVKTWRVKNSGTCDWEVGFQLIFVSGAQMNGPSSVSLPAVAAGSQTDISVNLTAPSAYGTHKGTWRIRSIDEGVFGTNLTVLIEVPAPATDTPTPTDTPIAPTEASPVQVDIVASADAYWWPKNQACMIGGCPDFGGGTELELTNNATGGSGGSLPILWPGLVAVQFDLSGIPAGATIESATMYLYLNSADGATTVELFARRATSPWSEGDHTVKPICETSGGSSRNVGSGSGWYEWKVDDDVAYQYANPTTDYGFCVTGGGADNTRIFRSREGASASRPYLRVVYMP
ncbi:MAG: NBR1-Ig-like domain-containing protein [Anaerolineae bacterium]|jgi:hypothetical protein